MMPYYTYMRSGKDRYLVLRWKKRINDVPTIVREVNVGAVENLARMLENSTNDAV